MHAVQTSTLPSTGELERLLRSAPSIADKILLALVAGTRLRTFEVLALRWMDLDLERGWIRDPIRPTTLPIPPAIVGLLLRRLGHARPGDYVLGAPPPRRHRSPRDAAAALDRARQLANLPASLTIAALEQVTPDHCPAEPLSPDSSFCFLAPPRWNHDTASPTMRLDLAVTTPDARGQREAAVLVRTPFQTITLDGITLGAPHLTVTIPPAESWQHALSALTPTERARVESVTFYRVIIAALAKRCATVKLS